MKLYELIFETYDRKKGPADPVLFQKVKDLWDEGLLPHEIAKALNVDHFTVSNLLHRFYPGRENRLKLPAEEVDTLKRLFDLGLPYEEIASAIGKTVSAVIQSLDRYYGERQSRTPEYSSEDIELIKSLFDQGLKYSEIEKETGFSDSTVRHIISKYHTNRKSRAKTPATPEQIIEITKMFIDGSPYEAIGKLFGFADTGIRKMVRRLPNFEELLQQRLANIELHKEAAKAAQANTDIYRPGSIGNDRLQSAGGRSNRATSNKKYF